MARQRKHEELQGLFGSDLEFLIGDHTMKVLCVVLMPGAEVGTHVGILWVDTLLETK